jgi:CRP-like cAMP-binding protein
MDVASVLHGCRFFSEVQADGFQRLAAIARVVKFDRDTLIFRERQECPGMYVVGSGLVRVFKIGANGKEHVLHMVGPGDTFAEVAAIGGFRLPANAEAVTDAACLLLPRDLFRKALEDDHQLCLEMITSLSYWVQHLVGLMGDVVLRDSVGRLARYLLNAESDQDDVIELPTLKRHLASHLNLTSETFSRTLRRLVDADTITLPDSNRVEIINRDKLRMIAEGLSPKV